MVSMFVNRVMWCCRGYEFLVLAGGSVLSPVPFGSQASEYIGEGAVIFVRSIVALEEKSIFEIDGLALFAFTRRDKSLGFE